MSAVEHQCWVAVVTTTVPSEAIARQLARSLVQSRLAACAQTEAITSHYYWQDALCEEPEWRIVFKTLPHALERLAQRLRAEHPYAVPQLLVRTEQCAADYAQWVRENIHE